MRSTTPGLDFERAFRRQGLLLVAGVDEAGRGAWAGPVAAGAVILPANGDEIAERLKDVRDSKLCTPRQREALDGLIREAALAVSVGMATAQEIDELRIGAATRLAMKRAIEGLSTQPQALLIDYVRLNEVGLPQRSFPKGESKSLSIASASIAAKVARDRLMVELDEQHPGYGLATHKGYGTRAHQAALKQLGPSPIHRLTFKPMQLRLMDTVDEPRARS